MMASAANRARCVAGIVIYRPQPEALQQLVASLADDVTTIAIYAYSPVSGEEQQALEATAGAAELVVLRPGLNRGLGAAYNALRQLAEICGSEFLFLLDQDSQPQPGLVGALTATYRDLMERGERVAVVGPQPVDREGDAMRLSAAPVQPRDKRSPVRTRFVISSGSLIPLDALAAIGDFRSDYFIDAIDIEWCLRAGGAGYSIWVDPAVSMPHQLGRGVIRLPLALLLTDQPPRRLYTYVRNQLAMLRLPHVPMRHKAKFVISLPVRLAVHLVHHGFSRDCVTALVNGLVDGVCNRLGPPDRALIPWWNAGLRSRFARNVGITADAASGQRPV